MNSIKANFLALSITLFFGYSGQSLQAMEKETEDKASLHDNRDWDVNDNDKIAQKFEEILFRIRLLQKLF